MPRHENTMFPGDNDKGSVLVNMWNIGVTACPSGDVVCFWPNTVVDDHARLFVRLSDGADDSPGTGASVTPGQYRVAGVVARDAALAPRNDPINENASGPICVAGWVSKLNVTGTVVPGDLLRLDLSKVGVGSEYTTKGSGIIFAEALSTNASAPNEGSIAAYVYPFRV
jgi:hypothetical protein